MNVAALNTRPSLITRTPKPDLAPLIEHFSPTQHLRVNKKGQSAEQTGQRSFGLFPRSANSIASRLFRLRLLIALFA
jgi:hypothetical protein